MMQLFHMLYPLDNYSVGMKRQGFFPHKVQDTHMPSLGTVGSGMIAESDLYGVF
jgi:hypothetical protein